MIRFEKPSTEKRRGAIFPALMAYWFAFCVYPLALIRSHPSPITATLDATMGVLAAIAWLITTPPRLKDLNLNQLWVAPLILPFAVAIVALWNQWTGVCWTFLVLGVVAQGLLVFIAPSEPANQHVLESIDAGGEQ